jgi:hypothetical protein
LRTWIDSALYSGLPPEAELDSLAMSPVRLGYWLLAISYWLLAIGYEQCCTWRMANANDQ